VDIGLRMAGALHRFWYIRGYYSEGQEQISAVLDLDTEREGPPFRRAARAQALIGAALLMVRSGTRDMHRALAEEALAISRELGDKRGMAGALLALAVIPDDPEKRRPLLEESRALFEEVGDTGNLGRVLYQFAHMADWQGDYQSAHRFLTESLEKLEQAGDIGAAALCLTDLGQEARTAGNDDAARSYFERGLALSKQVGVKWLIAANLLLLAEVTWRPDNPTGARPMLEEALRIRRETGDPSGVADTLLDLAQVSLAAGDANGTRALLEETRNVMRKLDPDPYAEARLLRLQGRVAQIERDLRMAVRLYRESLFVKPRESEHSEFAPARVACALAAIAEVEATHGEPGTTPERVARLLGAARALFEVGGFPLRYGERVDYERRLVLVREALGEEEFEKAWQEGQAMSMEEAVAYALEEAEHD
jgi:tetratricopeptide (TPR) repeat protein